MWKEDGTILNHSYDFAWRPIATTRGDAHGETWPDQTKSRVWELDGLGNWTRTVTTAADDSVTSESRLDTTFNEYYDIDGVSQSHDENGNLTDDGDQTYTWDAFNRLRAAYDDAGSTLGVYTYDAGHRRVRKDVSTSTGTRRTDFYYAAWQVLEEHEADATATPDPTLARHFVYGNYIDEPLIMDVNQDADPWTTGAADARYFYHHCCPK